MRGVYLHDQLEFRVETEGEEFRQGDKVACTLRVKNHKGTVASVENPVLQIAQGATDKVKAKADNAFETYQAADLRSLQIEPGQTITTTWTFSLDLNCPITEKSQSLYLLYGVPESLKGSGQLLLTVKPHPYIQQAVGILESTFQFVLKGEKSADGWAHFKLKPPSSKKLSLVEELSLGFRFEDEALLLRFSFKVKKFDTSVSTVAVKKGKSVVEQQLPLNALLLTPSHLNPEYFEAKVEEALATVSTGF